MRTFSILAAGAVAVTVGLTAIPAQSALRDCGNNRACMWANNNYEGDRVSRARGESAIRNVRSSFNNRMDFFANRSATYQTCAFSGNNGMGDEQDWEELEENENVSPFNSDEVSSSRTEFGC